MEQLEYPPGSLLDLPSELLVQILNSCEPASLLQLTRTCTTLRKLLYQPEANDIWQKCRLKYPDIKCRKTRMFPFGVSFTDDVQVTVPTPPSGMDEIAFARLVFEEACSNCQIARGKPYMVLQRRLCDACRQERCIRRDMLRSHLENDSTLQLHHERQVNDLLASVRLHCPRHRESTALELYWLDDVKSYSRQCTDSGKTSVFLTEEESKVSKANAAFETAWREWIEAE